MKAKPVVAWVLRGSTPPLYTQKAADIIKDKETGKEYIRGDIVFFEEGKLPERIEQDRDRWEFIYLNKEVSEMSLSDYARELFAGSLFGGK